MNENAVTPDSPEARFISLMSELFQLHEAEALGFGIYRVINRHNKTGGFRQRLPDPRNCTPQEEPGRRRGLRPL